MEWLTLYVMVALFKYHDDTTADDWQTHSLICCTFLHLNGVVLVILPLGLGRKIKHN